MSNSSVIDTVIAIAESDGNTVAEVVTGFETVDTVVFMQQPLSEAVRARFYRAPQLHYWRSERTPHNPAAEGYLDKAASVGISFPIAT